MKSTSDLAERQRIARETFDLDSFMASLPPEGPAGRLSPSARGQAGVRLRGYLRADISDDLLREFARETLGALRCSEQYLDALRIVLGNQADAERYGYTLEMNQRVSFAAPNVMRTIIDQMRRARLSFGCVVGLGIGRSQLVQCYASKAQHSGTAEDQLNAMYRRDEAEDDRRRGADLKQGISQESTDEVLRVFQTIDPDEVPY